VRISVILCTYNRHLYLKKALESLACSVLPGSTDWEVIVVDNRSSDQTPDVVKEFATQYPGRFRYVPEPKQGKSHALNTGIRQSRGDVLAFVDDDATVEPGWLWNLTKALNDGDWAGAGGRTRLGESLSLPRWLALSGPCDLGGVLAAQFDLGDEPGQLDKAPYGVNMAYRKTMFEKYGGFRTDLGPRPGSEIRNEDTEFGNRLLAAGERLRYEPSAIVYHPAPKNRIRREFFLKWYFDYGRAGILEVGRRPDVWGIQRRYWSIAKIAVVLLTVRMMRWFLSLDPSKRFFHKCFVWATVGQMVEIYRQWGPAKPATAGAVSDMDAVDKGKL
jgi:glucosyl-dolichyl phosphate glucuronosyltransferase